MEVSQNWKYFFGVPIMRTMVFGGPYWVPLLLGKYQIVDAQNPA